MKSFIFVQVQLLLIAGLFLLQTAYSYNLKAKFGTGITEPIKQDVSSLNHQKYNSFPFCRSFSTTSLFSSSSASATSESILQQCQQALMNFGQSVLSAASSTVISPSEERTYTANSLSEKREFIAVQNGNNIGRAADSKAVLRILQFNVLADCLSESGYDSGDFSRAYSEVLSWNYRKERLLKEIVQYQPDIITLQEVDHYHDFFLPKLRRLGYIGFFAPKPTSKCLECGKPADGCAMFINAKRLRVLCSETKTLASRKSDLSPKTSGLDGMQEEEFKIYTQNQVALIIACELIDENREVIQRESLLGADISNIHNHRSAPPIIICTAHLKSAKTETGEIFRLEGITNAMNSVQKLFETFTAQGNMPAVILSGDFNAVPGKTSRRRSDGSIEQYVPWTYPFVKQHPLDFRSVYNDDVIDRLSCGRQLFTTWKARRGDNNEVVVKRCIDYIFYAPFMQRTLDTSKATPANFVNFEETVTSTSSSSLTTRADNEDLFRAPALVMNKNQIALSFLGRIFVYATLLLLCTSAAISTESTLEVWRGIIVSGCVIGWWVFEASIEGTFFKPIISSKVPKPFVPPVDAPVIATNTASTSSNKKDKDKKATIEATVTSLQTFPVETTPLLAVENKKRTEDERRWMSQASSTINKLAKEVRYIEINFLRSVSEFSQRVSPLRQFGRPGFRCVAALDIFSEEAMEPDLIPSKDYPSDHVAIAADLELLW